jgi:outer membrane lipoprotein-sorting protein
VIALLVIALAAPGPTEVLAKVEATYQQPHDLTAQFTQTVSFTVTGKTTTSTGTLYLAKPDKLRFDYDKRGKRDKQFIFDGKTLWVVEPSKLQILKSKVETSQMPAALRFFTGAGGLEKEFTVATPKAPPAGVAAGATVLELAPKQPSAQYAHVYLVVDPSAWTVTQTIVINSSGDVNSFAFAKPSTAKIDATRFVFDPKAYPSFKVSTP